MQQPIRVVLGIVCLASPVVAQVIDVENPGFEDISGESPFNEFTFGPLNGWDLYDPGGIADGGDGPTFFIGTLTPYEADPIGNPGVYVNFPGGAAEGIRVAIAFNFFGSGDTGEYGLVQNLDDVLQPEMRYTIEVEIGNIASGVSMSGDFFDLEGFPGYRVDLLAGGVVIAQDDNLLAGSIAEGEFETSTVAFTAPIDHPQLGQSLGIRLVNLNQIDPAFPDANLEVDFDHVRLTMAPVSCLGDIVADGDVDTADLLALLGCWSPGGPIDPECLVANLNNDRSIDVSDLLILLANWGDCF